MNKKTFRFDTHTNTMTNTNEDRKDAAARDLLMIENTLDVAGMIENFTDRQRIAAVRLILNSIGDEGTIQQIRSLAAKERYDD
jgi:Mg/Co/Ni transporter MgtE